MMEDEKEEVMGEVSGHWLEWGQQREVAPFEKLSKRVSDWCVPHRGTTSPVSARLSRGVWRRRRTRSHPRRVHCRHWQRRTGHTHTHPPSPSLPSLHPPTPTPTHTHRQLKLKLVEVQAERDKAQARLDRYKVRNFTRPHIHQLKLVMLESFGA